jgi:hypothetical protein
MPGSHLLQTNGLNDGRENITSISYLMDLAMPILSKEGERSAAVRFPWAALLCYATALTRT